jgi:rhodanese-related sulfurtransferase
MRHHGLKLLIVTLLASALTACGSTQKESTSMVAGGDNTEEEQHQRSSEGATEDEVAAIVASGEETYNEDKTAIMEVGGQAAQVLASEDATLIDVRTAEEYEEAHIPDAVNIPVSEMSREAVQEADINGTVILYCNSGNRSAQAYEKLRDDGYAHQIYNLGAMSNWPGETVSGESPTPDE